MASESKFNTFIDEINDSTRDTRYRAYNWAEEYSEITREGIYSLGRSLVSAAEGFYDDTTDFIKGYSHQAFDSMQIYQLADYRQNFLAETPISYRWLSVVTMNLPIIYFSHGLRKVRNPIVFTTLAAALLVPELINPFNRR